MLSRRMDLAGLGLVLPVAHFVETVLDLEGLLV
jgi:hypothetical protein